MQIKRNLIWLGLGGQILCYFALLINWGFIRQWFYPFAWWSYILLIDGIIYRLKGNSLIVNRTKSFLMMLPWSVVIWLVFELINLRLENWYYMNLTPILWQRWLGYFLSFATVLPGIFETSEFLEAIGLYRRRRIDSPSHPRREHPPVFTLGLICIILPIVLPHYFFPLVWISFILVLEPLNYRLGGNSLWLRSEWGKILRLVTAGLICGILWEFWNSHAQSSWVYNLPYLHFWKIFEMPILGYLGFLPFALECYLMYQFVVITGYSPDWETRGTTETSRYVSPSRSLRIISIIMIVTFITAMFYLIDSFTVRYFIGE